MSTNQNNTQELQVKSVLSSLNFQWRALFYRFLRNWYWFLLSLIAILFLTWLFLRSASPTYMVRGTFLLREEQYNSSFSQDVGVVIETQGAKMQQLFLDQTQIMKSLSLMRQVIDSLDIDTEFYVNGRLRKAELYGNEVPFKIMSASPRALFNGKRLQLVPIDSQRFGVIRNENDTLTCTYGVPFKYKKGDLMIQRAENSNAEKFDSYEVQFRDPIKVARQYSKKINFNPVAKSFVIAASLVDEKPSKAIDIINTLLKLYNLSVVDDKNKVGQNTLAFIQERLNEMEDELFAVEKRVENYKKQEDIPLELATRTQLLLTDLSQIEELIIQLRVEIQILENFRNTLQEDIQEFEYLPVSSEVNNSAVADLFSNYNSLVLERERLLQDAKRDNPVVQRKEQEITDMRSNILTGLAVLIGEKKELLGQQEARLIPFQKRVIEVPRNERELFDIERQKLVKDELYRFLLQKKEETRLNMATQVSDTKMVDEPMLQSLVFPKTIQVFILAFFFAMLLPAGVLFIRESTDNNVYSEGDIAQVTKTPFLGAIAQSRSKKTIVVRRSSRSAIAEMFRLLRTNLQFLLGDTSDKTPVVLITSATSGEGKTFTSLNLAMSLAISGKKTVIIGADLRKPKMSLYLTGAKSTEGLSNYLAGQMPLEELVQPTDLDENFFYIGSGPLPPNPAELLMQDKMKELLEYLRQYYDFVLVDISPVGLVADALLLKDQVDASIFVTRFKVTKKGALHIVDDIYQGQKLPNPAIVLNGVKQGKAYGYGSGRYGYGYGYGYGYYEEDKSEKWWNRLLRRNN